MVNAISQSIEAIIVSVGPINNDAFNLIVCPESFPDSSLPRSQTPILVKYTADNLDIEPSALPEYRELIERMYDHKKDNAVFRVKLNITAPLNKDKVQYTGQGIIEFLND
ncbi:MAG TPA: hypothetical protein VI815_00175 [Candidatus Nanoarchaeia archaeon]|nr:hypothetical protein [Candidatus Nanoarchaeia archaeon]